MRNRKDILQCNAMLGDPDQLRGHIQEAQRLSLGAVGHAHRLGVETQGSAAWSQGRGGASARQGCGQMVSGRWGCGHRARGVAGMQAQNHRATPATVAVATGQSFMAGAGPQDRALLQSWGHRGCILMGKGVEPKARAIGQGAGPQGRPA